MNYFTNKGSIGNYNGVAVYMYPGEYEKYKRRYGKSIIVADYEGTMVKDGYIVGYLKKNGSVEDVHQKIRYEKEKEERVEDFSFSHYTTTVDKFFEELKALDNC